jgi:hypothetical protein
MNLRWNVVVLAAVISTATMIALALWIITSNAIDIIGEEMNVLFSIQRILLGHPLYESPAAPPYAIAQYSPLYYYLVTVIATIGRIYADDVLSIAAIARAVSVVMASMLVFVIYRFAMRRLGSSAANAFVATAFLVGITANWYFVIRPDGLATLLTMSAFYLVASPHLTRRGLIGASVLCVAAVFAKQNGFFAGSVVILFLMYRRLWREAGIAAATMLLAAVVGLALLSFTGPAIRANLVDGLNNGVAVRAALMTTYRPVFYWLAPLIAFGLAAVPRLLRKTSPSSDNLLAIAVVVSFAMSTVTALKRGSAENYFNEFAILAVLAFLSVYCRQGGEAAARIDSTTRMAFTVYAASLLLVRAGHQVYTTYLYHRVSPETRLTSQMPPASFTCNRVAGHRYIIGFAVGLSNVCPDRMIFPEQALADAAQRRELVDYSQFSRDLSAGRVQFIIMKNGEEPRQFLRHKLDGFVPLRRFAYYTVYERR